MTVFTQFDVGFLGKKGPKNRFPEPRFVTPHPRNSAAGNRFLSIFFMDSKEKRYFLENRTQKNRIPTKKWTVLAPIFMDPMPFL
jgi:hypothetical protein